ncbi:sugar ABC transporter substrate-binding protein [Paenibacillus hexagrammi]|uniref:Extracellular solute-binding protein n=1 Tax=Paenibacillus hexagrammi TaxID=2908839 RepID=A0ABY3SCN3_9BACL|nr:extracellular solute-binding protein [Paenibacillus sp. YPD9-1]UJF31754.1 extracellular solute-binding protein [Paenibacillus sp. YPD9-1]
MTTHKKEIVLWHEFDGPGDTSIEVLEEICQLYSQRNNVRVVTEVMSIQELGRRIGEVAGTDLAPHIAFVPADMACYYESGKYSQVPGDFVEDLLDSDALATMQVNGMQYGIPTLLGNHLVLYYNKDVWDEAPQSWDAIAALQPGLQSKGIIPIGADLEQSYWFIPFLTAFGGWLMKDGKPDLIHEPLLQALQFVLSQLEQGTMVSLNGSTDLLETFISGEVGAIICGEWNFDYLSQHMKDKLGVGRLPRIHGQASVPMSSSIGMIFPNGALEGDLREELRSFARFMLSVECQLKWADQVQRIPANSSARRLVTANSTPNKAQILALLQESRPMPIDTLMIHNWVAMEQGLRTLFEEKNPEAALGQIEKTLHQALVEVGAR